MWQDLGYDEASCEDLLTELRTYRRKEKPYTKRKNHRQNGGLALMLKRIHWQNLQSKYFLFHHHKQYVKEIFQLSNGCLEIEELDSISFV